MGDARIIYMHHVQIDPREAAHPLYSPPPAKKKKTNTAPNPYFNFNLINLKKLSMVPRIFTRIPFNLYQFLLYSQRCKLVTWYVLFETLPATSVIFRHLKDDLLNFLII